MDAKVTNPPVALIAGAPDAPFPAPPPAATLTSVVVPVCTSRTKTSGAPLVSPGTRFDAADWKTTKRPSADTSAFDDGPLRSPPPAATLTRVTAPSGPVRKTSATPFWSPATRFDADETNATRPPSADSTGELDGPLAPPGAAEIRRRSPVATLKVNTSRTAPLASLGMKPPAVDENPMICPLADSDVSPLSPSSWLRSGAVETRKRTVRQLRRAGGRGEGQRQGAGGDGEAAGHGVAAEAGGRARPTARPLRAAGRAWAGWRRAWTQPHDEPARVPAWMS